LVVKRQVFIFTFILSVTAVVVLVWFFGKRIPTEVSLVHEYTATHEQNRKSIETTLIATGDVMLGRSVHLRSKQGGDPFYPFRKVAELLNSADVVLVNLENPLFDPCPEHDDGFKFCSPVESVQALKYAGISVANLANNHSTNYGRAGYSSTVEALRNSGILASDETTAAVIENKGTRFGSLGFNETFKNLNYNNVSKKITLESFDVDVLFVSFHWGEEYQFVPNLVQRELARLAIDSGADVVIGHHPHVVQSMEVYKGKPIFYSLGNFVFDQMWSEETKEGILVKFMFEGSNLKSYEPIPVKTYELGQPSVVADDDTGSLILERLYQN
jgi:poly-gamma-glutamate capsule biosynthesis protein CapA/YwtB (metallophosphatase superfamily)